MITCYAGVGNVKRTEIEVIVQNRQGLHARPAAMLVKLASGFAADISLVKDGEPTDCKSILSVMMLAAGSGTKLRVVAEGAPDAEGAAAAVAKLFGDKFDEE